MRRNALSELWRPPKEFAVTPPHRLCREAP